MVPSSGRERYCRENAGSAEEYGYTGKQDNVYLRCFDVVELKRIRTNWNPKWGWISIWFNLLRIPTGMKHSLETAGRSLGKNYNYDWMFKAEL